MVGQPLVIPVGASIRDLERAMRQAVQLVDRSATEMEDRFGRIDLAARFGVGALQGAIAAISFEKVVSGIVDANREIAKFGDTARRSGLDVARFQELRLAAGGLGIEGKSFDSGVQGLAKALNEARREENDLAKLLDANGIKYKDRKGEVISTNEALAVAADLISRAATEQDKIAIAERFGLPADFLPLLEGGAAALNQLARNAAEAGTILDSEVIARAKEFDTAWTNAWTVFGANAKAAVVSAAQGLASLIGQAGQYIASVDAANKAAFAADRDLRAQRRQQAREMGLANAGGRDAVDAEQSAASRRQMAAFRQSEIDLRNRQVDNAPLPPSRPARLFSGDATVLPKKGGGSGGGGGGGGGKSDEERAQDRLERYIETLTRQNAVLDAEIATFGKSNAEKRAAIELAKAGVDLAKLDEAERQKTIANLTREIELSEQKRTTLERLKMAQQGVNDAARYFGNAGIDALEDFIFNGAKAEDVAKRLAVSLAKAALQAVLLGDGSLAGVFGTKAGSGGGMGGLLGGLLGSFGGARAGGGPVSPGKAYVVGEKRPELFVPNSAGRIVPRVPDAVMPGGGGSGSTISYADQRQINITPADGVTPEQMTQALAAYDRQSRRNIASVLQTAGARF
ncbi:hypothetical protein IED13_15480 [Bosea sp. SSUT16]|uniref:Bacteriophage tail tape measure N-terminal domain-containing protein n=1 Tax=Bosea spartocytisi TaxID=2773451 RepID=A0A927EAP9_9HYPH|nr:hypothetical protein [Bosea spartocytisi]MBD3847110.1 hypothetical protein [Bosea spartocytisi]MCT4474194.1 hypothetical protein [Bosea spartocytisi]